MSSSLLEGLNPQQLEAVTLPRQSALILAGAGSGKTRVLTTRIAWLIHTGQVGPLSLLAVTFTNKAAREMLARISAMLPINTRGMWIGTFHGLCNRMLRAHYRDAGLPQSFQILDSADQLSMVKRVVKALGMDDEKYPPKQAQYFINANKEAGLRAAQVEATDDFSRRYNQVYAAYDAQCNREGVVDFAELLLRCYELLAKNEALRAHYQARFRHILVDEFQDTNRLQYLWLKLLAGPQGAVFAVGDDDQSIYAFRGARSGNMFDFERDFGVQKVIKLEQNYRSQGNILDAANALIRHNRARLGKNLWTAEGKGESLRLYEASTDVDEAAYILDEVRSLNSEGVRLSDIALLYRSNAQSRVLEHALFNAGISYRVYGGLRFFERQEIKHALAYLRLTANPEDDGAFLRVANFPARGIGGRTLEQLQASAEGAAVSLWRAACGNAPAGKAGTSLAAFVRLIEDLRAATRDLPLPEIVEHVIEASGLVAHYKGEKEGAERVENLEELVNAATAFAGEEGFAIYSADRTDGAPEAAAASNAPETGARRENVGRSDALNAFLSHAALEAGEHQAAAGADALQLMTVHSAKGLEFDTVFISGLEEGLFPHENSLTEDGGLEEERRLMYVAITRARRRLHLTHAQTRMLHGHTRYNVASRFLDEIPAALVRRVSASAALPALPPSAAGALPARAAASLRSYTAGGFRIGQSVTHPKFGAGVIVQAEGRGADARVQVNFRDAGLKWLALEYARLQAV
ncbi:MAG TPA: UvrD-helicase domain-containing protein [Burkholderiales bacterium]|nr:UvrD-helicase domain-containing protein [Burkholderiales bacterium]